MKLTPDHELYPVGVKARSILADMRNLAAAESLVTEKLLHAPQFSGKPKQCCGRRTIAKGHVQLAGVITYIRGRRLDLAEEVRPLVAHLIAGNIISTDAWPGIETWNRRDGLPQ